MTDCPSDALEAPLDPFEREAAAWARSQGRLVMTHELAEVGMDLARALRAEVMARVSGVENAEGEAVRVPVFGADVGLVYSRIARAVRMSLALEAVIDGDVQVRAERVVAERHSRKVMDEIERCRAEHERQQGLVRDAVTWAIDKDVTDRTDAREAARLRWELNEVLEDDREWEQFTGLPLIETVERICADLGVAFDTELWMDLVEAEGEDGPDSPVSEPVDPADPPDGLDRALEAASGGDGAWPASSGKPRPP